MKKHLMLVKIRSFYYKKTPSGVFLVCKQKYSFFKKQQIQSEKHQKNIEKQQKDIDKHFLIIYNTKIK